MRRRLIVGLAVIAALLPVPGIVGGAATIQPRLRLLDADPVAFRGTGFKAHERVRVSVYAGTRAAKRVTAGVRGRFVVRFSGVDPNTCTGFSASAVGTKGSRASFKRAPGMCPAP
jgi:hypothetical protein